MAGILSITQRFGRGPFLSVSGDPFDHVTTFKQAVHAEQVSNTHTQVEGFGLTLESKALTWF